MMRKNPLLKINRHSRIIRANTSRRPGMMAVVALVATCATTTFAGSIHWVGPSDGGGNGKWNVTDNWQGLYNTTHAIPTADDWVYFDSSTSSSPTTITIGSGVNANVQRFTIRNGRDVTLQLKDGASLTDHSAVGDFTFGVSGDTEPSHLTIQGPDSGAATMNIARIYSDASMPGSTLTFSGEHLTVQNTQSQPWIRNISTIITNGAHFEATGGGSSIVLKGTGDNGIGRLTIENGSVSGSAMSLYEGETILQIANGGMLKAEGESMSLEARSPTSRVEAEGSGIDSSVTGSFKSGSILAVGVTPVGGSRTSAQTLTLQSQMSMNGGSHLEFGLFGNGDNDRIVLNTGGELSNLGGGAIVDLVVEDGYTTQYGDSYALIDNQHGTVSGNFDTSALAASGMWDLSQFNAADGWIITAVPEPGSVGILLLAGAGAMALRRRGRKSVVR